MEPFTFDRLHPAARADFLRLAEALTAGFAAGETHTRFLPFEGYRDLARQEMFYEAKQTKARPWCSAHQYGLAVDFVGMEDGRWHWDGCDWDYLRRIARLHGFHNDISWDRSHVEHQLWLRVRGWLLPTLKPV